MNLLLNVFAFFLILGVVSYMLVALVEWCQRTDRRLDEVEAWMRSTMKRED
jgi:hypothetical protein